MARLLVARLGQAAVVLAGVVLLTFALVRVLPGDPAVAVAGPRASAAQLAAVRERLGLDAPLLVQLGRYAGGLLRGDLGTSLHTRQPVAADLARVLPASLELVAAALLLAVLVGVPLGVLAARRHRTAGDFTVRLTATLAASVPVFWSALVLQQVFATRLGWFPVAGEYACELQRTSPLRVRTHVTVLDAVISGNGPVLLSTLHHLVLPAVVLAAYPAGVLIQLTRACLVQEAAQDHARLARALGLGRTRVLLRHCLRPVLNPLLSLLALTFAYALVGSVLVESIFNWPGLGRYLADAVITLDTPAIAGVTLIVALLYVIISGAVEVLHGVIDPRVRP